jgi:hypothetical protein
MVLVRANSMGIVFSRRKIKEPSPPAPTPPVEPEDRGLRKIKKTFNEDLENFVLNNLLLSVQFFEHFER